MRVAIISHRPSATNLGLVARGWNGIAAELMSPREALLTLGRGDVALGRLDVSEELDGVEEGLWALDRLAESGVQLLNPPKALQMSIPTSRIASTTFGQIASAGACPADSARRSAGA